MCNPAQINALEQKDLDHVRILHVENVMLRQEKNEEENLYLILIIHKQVNIEEKFGGSWSYDHVHFVHKTIHNGHTTNYVRTQCPSPLIFKCLPG